jgi:hypothetical protein
VSEPPPGIPTEELTVSITLDLNAELEIVAELRALNPSHRQTGWNSSCHRGAVG